MSSFSRAFLGKGNESKADINDEVSFHCILGQISDVKNVPQAVKPILLDPPTAAELCGTQPTDASCQHAARRIGTVRRFTVDDHGLG